LPMLNKPSPPQAAPNYRSARTRQPVFWLFFAIAATERISEKNAAFGAHFDRNGPGHDV
jgi:hypothetical protein